MTMREVTMRDEPVDGCECDTIIIVGHWPLALN